MSDCELCEGWGVISLIDGEVVCSECEGAEGDYNPEGDSMEYDAWVLAGAGWGMDEDYGVY